jgi:hypothetical protein
LREKEKGKKLPAHCCTHPTNSFSFAHTHTHTHTHTLISGRHTCQLAIFFWQNCVFIEKNNNEILKGAKFTSWKKIDKFLFKNSTKLFFCKSHLAQGSKKEKRVQLVSTS